MSLKLQGASPGDVGVVLLHGRWQVWTEPASGSPRLGESCLWCLESHQLCSMQKAFGVCNPWRNVLITAVGQKLHSCSAPSVSTYKSLTDSCPHSKRMPALPTALPWQRSCGWLLWRKQWVTLNIARYRSAEEVFRSQLAPRDWWEERRHEMSYVTSVTAAREVSSISQRGLLEWDLAQRVT